MLSNLVDWRKELAANLRAEKETIVEISNNRSDAISALSSTDHDVFIVDDTYSAKDIQILLKYLSIYKSKLHIFFVSKEFETFKDILKILSDFKINLITAPILPEELSKNIHLALKEKNTPSEVDRETRMNVAFLKIFTDATKKILHDFCAVNSIQFQKPRLVRKNEVMLPYAIRGSISLESNLFQGNYYIHFDQRTYLNIVNRLLMTEDNEINEENKDFAGEIVNMIYGQAKIELNQSGYNFDKAFPKFEVLPFPIKPIVPIVQLVMTTELGDIEILIEIKKMEGYII